MKVIKRQAWIDNLRGIIIFLMVSGHIERAINTSLASKNIIFLVFDKLLYSFHMPVMFFLSGLLFKSSKDLYNGQLKKRVYLREIIKIIIKLYIPYLVWIYGYWTLKYFIYSGNEVVIVKDLLVLWYQPRWNLWFLPALCYIEILARTIDFYFCNTKFVLAFFILYAIIYSVFRPNGAIFLYTFYAVFFYYGFFLKMNYQRYSYTKIILAILIVFVSISATYNGAVYIGMLMAGIGICYLLFGNRKFFNNRLLFFDLFGKYSLEIYVCHFMGASLIVKMLNLIFNNVYIIWFFGTIICVTYPLIVPVLYNKTPIFHCIKYLFHPYELFQRKVEKREQLI